jgi:hypothetical protein
MTRSRARVVALVAAALLAGLAVGGCGRHEATAQPTAAPVTSGPSFGQGGASGSVTPSGSATPAVSQAPSQSASPSTPAGPATPDPVASELDQINQLIQDINNSVQSSDSSQQGGE